MVWAGDCQGAAPTHQSDRQACTPTPTIAFVMEQHLGHRTYADNLRAALTANIHLETRWIPVSYGVTNEWWERLPSEVLRAALRGRSEVRRGLRGVRADACVFNSQVPAVIGGRGARRWPYVLCMDDTPRLKDSMAAGYEHTADTGLTGWLKHRLNRRVLHQASAIAPWSYWVRSSLMDDYGVDPTKIEVIPPGVDVSAWHAAEHEPGSAMKVLFVGGDFQRKGGGHLLDAFLTLPPGVATLRIVTRSEVPAAAGVELFRDLSPNDPHLRELFRTSDVFVLPSDFEMFGIAAVEAAAAGLALIVTSVGGLGELVVDGVTGYSMLPGDVDALASHLRVLADHPERRREMGRAARRRAEAEFDANTNAQRLVELALRCVRGA